MNIGETYYYRQDDGLNVKITTAEIVEISDDREYAILSNGKKINPITGRQIGTKRYWYPMNCADESVKKYMLATKARNWFKKMLSVDEIAVNLYRKLIKKTSIDTRAYYHLMTDEAKKAINSVDISFLKDNYKQPDWCCNMNALNGCLGCEHLILGKVKKPQNCFFCMYFIRPRLEKYRRLRLLMGLTIPFCNQMLGISDYAAIESGERPATQRELNIMEAMFNINSWSLDQVKTYFRTTNEGNRTSDPVYLQFGHLINNKINISKIYEDKKNIKFSPGQLYRKNNGKAGGH